MVQRYIPKYTMQNTILDIFKDTKNEIQEVGKEFQMWLQ